jgi:hypothetical protein
MLCGPLRKPGYADTAQIEDDAQDGINDITSPGTEDVVSPASQDSHAKVLLQSYPLLQAII